MKKIIAIVTVFTFCAVSAQRNLAFDSLKLNEVQDLFADDYGNIYLYKNKDFSFSKYDSLGVQKGKLMLTLPFKIQSVQNPLKIPSFSENAQELKFFDQNLNEIQSVNFRQKFGFIKMVYAEDLQQIWLLDESTKRLIQYNFRDDRIINSFPFDTDFELVIDFLVFENQVYILTKDQLSVYNLKSEKVLETQVSEGKRLRRENRKIFIVGKRSVQKLSSFGLEVVFAAENSQFVDKNSSAYFVIRASKLYLYHP